MNRTPAERRLTERQKKRLKTLAEGGFSLRRVAKLMDFRDIEVAMFARQLGYDHPDDWTMNCSEFRRKIEGGS